jgi:hypothetical protein
LRGVVQGCWTSRRHRALRASSGWDAVTCGLARAPRKAASTLLLDMYGSPLLAMAPLQHLHSCPLHPPS